MRIVWNGYIEDQLSWARSLSAIASEADTCSMARRMREYAERALDNARTAQRRNQDPPRGNG